MADDLGAVFRSEAGRCTASLIRVLGDVDLAEDAVAEAFSIAAAQWPSRGLPPNPGAWIAVTARRRAMDRLRRESTRKDRYLAADRLRDHGSEIDASSPLEEIDALADFVADDQLRLMFFCCHPSLAPDAQVALTLRLLGGLETGEIARAFLVPESTMAQRIVRAKRKLRENHAPYRIPSPNELAARLRPVLAAVYLIFNEGHTATSGDRLSRIDLPADAIRLGRVLAELMSDEPEVLGLLALMLLTESRRRARTDADGVMVALADQERALWDRDLIEEGHELVRQCLCRNRPGLFQWQAAIAAVHADSPTAEATDWSQIVALYDQLMCHSPNPVVSLNRAVAVAGLNGPVAGLAALDAVDVAALHDFQPYFATRADLLSRSGRIKEADVAYDRAIHLTMNSSERRFLEARQRSLTRNRD